MSRKWITVLASAMFLMSWPVVAQQELTVKPLVEKKVAELPAGPLFWRIENFPTVEQAQAAAGPTALVAEADGKVWLFTLGAAGGASAGGTKVAELGPLPGVQAPEYLLRVNEATSPQGGISAVHTHPGSEAFYVLAGEMNQKTSHGDAKVAAGESMVGHGADTPMQVSSTGSTDLHSLIMFVVDATKPFSSPAEFK